MSNDGEIILSTPGHASLTLPVSVGYAPQTSPSQNVSKSGGGVIRTTHLAPEGRTLSIPLQALTRQEFLDLKSLIDAAKFSAVGITIEDPFETHERMHYTSGLDGGSRWSRGDEYSTTLRFTQSAVESLLLGANLVSNPTFADDGDGWEKDGGTDSEITYISLTGATDPAENAVQMADADADWEAVVSEQKFSVTDYLHTVGIDVRRAQGRIEARLFVKFLDEDGDLIRGDAETGGNWADRGEYHYWLTIEYDSSTTTTTATWNGDNSETFSGTDWKDYEATFGRSGGEIPSGAVAFQIGIEGSGGLSSNSIWQFTNYDLEVSL